MVAVMPVDMDTLFEVDKLKQAREWRAANPEAWKRIVEWAHEDAEHIGRCSMAAYVEALRSYALYRRLSLNQIPGEQYKIPNALAAGFVRLMLEDYPHLPFRTMHSQFD